MPQSGAVRSGGDPVVTFSHKGKLTVRSPVENLVRRTTVSGRLVIVIASDHRTTVGHLISQTGTVSF